MQLKSLGINWIGAQRQTPPPLKVHASPSERRKDRRFDVDLPLDYSQADNKESYGGTVVNVSKGGSQVYLSRKLDIGTFLKIEIFYVRELELDAINAIAKVVWSDDSDKDNQGRYCYGLKFLSIAQRDLTRLVALLKVSTPATL